MGEVRTFQALADSVETPQAEDYGNVRRVNPGAMSHDERARLVADIEARKVFALQFKVKAFGSGPNLNNARLTPEQIDELAASASGADLMIDHAHSAAASVGDTLGAEARTAENGERLLILDHELTDPDAMIRFARRQLRRFSISIEAADWKMSNAGTEILAVSPVRLIHNAFVSDPAYRGASVISNQTNPRQTMPDNEKAGAVDQSAQIAALEATVAAQAAELTEAKTKLEARESAAFSAELDRACQAGKIKPTARAQYDAARKAMGFDAAVGLLGGLADGNALPIAPVGDAPTATVKNHGISTPEKTAEFVAAEVSRITGKPYDPTKIKRV